MKCRAKLDAAEGNSDLASEVESGKRKICQPAEWTENETSESSEEEVNRSRLPRPAKPFAGLLMHEGDVLHQQLRDRMDSDISREEIDPNQQETFSVGFNKHAWCQENTGEYQPAQTCQNHLPQQMLG